MTPKERRNRARCKAIEILGFECVRCGCSDSRVLEFDHVSDTGNVDRKTLGLSQDKLVRQISKGNYRGLIQLLCANCHHIKSLEGK